MCATICGMLLRDRDVCAIGWFIAKLEGKVGMPTRYLVLRTNAPIEEGFEPANPAAWKRTARGGPSELSLQIEQGHEKDESALRADPKNACVLDADTVFTLIKPKAKSAPTSEPEAHV